MLTLNATRQADPLNRCERADVYAQLAATGSLDLSSVALRNVICSLQEAGASAAFCSGTQWREEAFLAGAINEQRQRQRVQQSHTSSQRANFVDAL